MSEIELKAVNCECGKNVWVQAMSFGVVPAVLSENGKAGLAPVKSTFICAFCGKTIEETPEYKEMEAYPQEEEKKIIKP